MVSQTDLPCLRTNESHVHQLPRQARPCGLFRAGQVGRHAVRATSEGREGGPGQWWRGVHQGGNGGAGHDGVGDGEAGAEDAKLLDLPRRCWGNVGRPRLRRWCHISRRRAVDERDGEIDGNTTGRHLARSTNPLTRRGVSCARWSVYVGLGVEQACGRCCGVVGGATRAGHPCSACRDVRVTPDGRGEVYEREVKVTTVSAATRREETSGAALHTPPDGPPRGGSDHTLART